MTLNGNSKTVMGIIISVIVTVFIMLFTGVTSSVDNIRATSRENRERVVAVEVKMENLIKKIDEIRIDQKDIRKDIKEILQKVK